MDGICLAGTVWQVQIPRNVVALPLETEKDADDNGGLFVEQACSLL